MTRSNMRRIVQVCLLFAFASCVSCGSHSNGSSSQISISPFAGQIPVGNYDIVNAEVSGNPTATVNWAVNGIPNGNSMVGTIVPINPATPINSTAVRYLAPAVIPNPSTVTISVALQSDAATQASTGVMVGPDITISPAAGLVPEFGSQQFSAIVTGGLTNTTVTWQLSCAAGGSACGAISPTGLYKAPNSVPTMAQNGSVVAQDVNLTVTSQAAPLFSTSFTITIVPPNQNQQTVPIQLGTSGSNINDVCNGSGSGNCGGGTFGSLLQRGGSQYILTNWHIAAATDGGVVGDPFVQPGLLDSECVSQGSTTAGNLTELLNPQTETGNKVDAAIAQVVSGAVDSTGAILELGSTLANGVPQSGAPAAGSGTAAYVGEPVAKSGRSTGLTCAAVQSVATSINITYNNECSTTTYTVRFSNQVVVAGSNFWAAGDSGSLIVDQSTAEAVALFFGGDANSAVGNPVSDVLAALKDSSGNVPTFVGGPEHTIAGCNIPAPTATKRQATRMSLADIQSAITIKEKHVSELMSDPAVQGVGVGASADNTNSPALIAYVLKDSAHGGIPATIEGLPVRVIETTGFHAGNAGIHNHKCGAPRS